MIGGCVLVHLPVQAELVLAVLLQAVHANVAPAGDGILGDDVRHRHVRAAVIGPLELNRQQVEVGLGPDDLLAGTGTHDLGARVGDALEAA